jgi:hypothetical protein
MNNNLANAMVKPVQLSLLMGVLGCLMFLVLSFILNALPSLMVQIASVTWNSSVPIWSC